MVFQGRLCGQRGRGAARPGTRSARSLRRSRLRLFNAWVTHWSDAVPRECSLMQSAGKLERAGLAAREGASHVCLQWVLTQQAEPWRRTQSSGCGVQSSCVACSLYQEVQTSCRRPTISVLRRLLITQLACCPTSMHVVDQQPIQRLDELCDVIHTATGIDDGQHAVCLTGWPATIHPRTRHSASS